MANFPIQLCQSSNPEITPISGKTANYSASGKYRGQLRYPETRYEIRLLLPALTNNEWATVLDHRENNKSNSFDVEIVQTGDRYTVQYINEPRRVGSRGPVRADYECLFAGVENRFFGYFMAPDGGYLLMPDGGGIRVN